MRWTLDQLAEAPESMVTEIKLMMLESQGDEMDLEDALGD